MRYLVRLGCAGAGAVLMGVLGGGCSTVVLSDNRQIEQRQSTERQALAAAASEVSATKWPRPQPISWRARLTGVDDRDDARITDEEAVRAYLRSLGSPQTGFEIILADAARHLEAARNLATTARAAATAIRPVMSDVTIVEDAIVGLRSTRDIYLASLKAVAKNGAPITNDQMRELKYAFNGAIEELGAAADELVHRVAENESETFAGPADRRDSL